MKWKPEAVVTGNPQDGYLVQLGEKKKEILSEHQYLLEAVQGGMEVDEALIHQIMETEQIDETAARFGLADFLIEYAEYIAEDTSYYEIV